MNTVSRIFVQINIVYCHFREVFMTEMKTI